MNALIAGLGIQGCILAARGAGAAVAAEVFATGSHALPILILDERPLALDADLAHQIAPDLPLSPLGAHWLEAWLMVRDGEIYHPWFDGRVASQRADQGCFEAGWLHDQTVALMDSRETYFRFPRAAVQTDPMRALAAAGVQVTVAAPGDFRRVISAALKETGHPSP
jgi:hypothetical protein